MISLSVTDVDLGQTIQIVDSRIKPSREKMYRVGEAIINIVKGNFLVSGRPEAWPKRRDGSTSQLIKSGRLVNSLRIGMLDETSVTVIAGEGIPYAAIHQTGGIINHPGSKKFQVFEIGGQIVFTRGTKPHKIPIPQRRYMNIPPDEQNTIKQAYLTPTI